MRNGRVLCLCFFTATCCITGCASQSDENKNNIASLIVNLGEKEGLCNKSQTYLDQVASDSFDKLLALGGKAVPHLVSATHSEKDANDIFQESTLDSTTVGDVSIDLINRILTDNLVIGVLAPRRVTQVNVDDWWAVMKDKPFQAVKIAALDWLIHTSKAKSYPAFQSRIVPTLKDRLELYRQEAP